MELQPRQWADKYGDRMTLVTLALSGIAIAAGAAALAWVGNEAEDVPVAAAQAVEAVFHRPDIDLGRLAQACGNPG
jgi:hypothetical protein